MLLVISCMSFLPPSRPFPSFSSSAQSRSTFLAVVPFLLLALDEIVLIPQYDQDDTG